ncbi:ABC transporter permease [Bacteroidota bacterium]
METYFKMAWRNLWRNKKRTIITIASIFFAILLSLLMRAMQKGTYSHMLHNVVQSYSGYIQIQQKDFWDEKTIDYSFSNSDDLISKVNSIDNVTLAVPRLESFALASIGNKTKGALVIGIDPNAEDQLTKLAQKLRKGKIIDINSKGALVSERLAKYLKLDVNDTVVLIGQGYHGISAADKFVVEGIIKIPHPELDNKTIYLPLPVCQDFYSTENMLTSISLNLDNIEKMDKTIKEIETVLNNDEYAVKSWKEIMPELVQMIESDNASGLIFLILLYIIIAFGIFGTVLMMTAERKREFGVIIALGMQKLKLEIILITEMIIIGILGIISGIIASIPIILYFVYNPIKFSGESAKAYEQFGFEAVMPFAWQIDYFINQSLAVVVIIIIAIIYPITSVTRIKVSKALRA